ncbi:MAG: NADPH-dependent assimilatory sulfite reductase hemoprotein subunit [Planctomycetaceae bacterium]|jgi:sulfite reductase (ferredoxin)|nr:NADPH-dependent assimilatory sulfite reductase hemoprotein subunit [Planctomycetaceae bacterium]
MSDDSMTPTNTDANNEPKLSPVELIKDASRYLRGSIGSELLSDSNHFGKDDLQLLKFHGTYQQDDREQRKSSGESGKSEKEYSFMVRTRIPAGIMTAQQLLAHLDLCDTIGNSTLKITTRQGLQLHGILKQDLRECMQKINQCMLTTLAACGDVNRNTMACPAPYNDSVRATVQKLAQDISDHLSPRTQSYYELWLKDLTSGQETLEGGSDQLVEPIYGKTYLPRKFKTAIALADDNCTDVYTNCLGFIAVVRDGQVIGYNVVVGGGLGVTPSAKKTFPRLASRMAFVTPEQAVGVAEAVVKVQRDFGYRDDRKRARLKYLVHDQGIEWMRHKVEEYYGTKLKDCTPDDVIEHRDHMGWDEQGDGRCFYGFNVENGRLYDDDQRAWKLALREICEEFQPEIRLTAHQSVLFCNLPQNARPKLEKIIKNRGLPLTEEISNVRRWSIACVALPTCGLAITESERALPGVIDVMEKKLLELGLDKELFTVRMTGCPNGCARPYNADIGLVGKAKGKYTVYVGGTRLGTRLGFIYKDLVPLEKITDSLEPLFRAFRDQRTQAESFGDWCTRLGLERLQELGA